VGSTQPASVRLPRPLREQLFAVAAAEERTFSSLVVTLLDRGLTARAREQALVAAMVPGRRGRVTETVLESVHGDGCACTRCQGFQLGNTLSLHHGATSERQIRPLARNPRRRVLRQIGIRAGDPPCR
jgi:hypothetical protein